MKKKLLKKGDIVLAVFVLLFCLVLFLFLYPFNNSDGSSVQIEVGGTVTATLPIDKDAVYEVKNNNGVVTNKVVISNGKVSMEYADCRDQICVNHKEISKSNESIICLPNKVVVTVVSDDSGELDGVV